MYQYNASGSVGTNNCRDLERTRARNVNLTAEARRMENKPVIFAIKNAATAGEDASAARRIIENYNLFSLKCTADLSR